MKAVILCLCLLICMSLCTSRAILKCRCLNRQNKVRESLIADIHVIPPTPYCSRTEVIVTLKNGKSVCLNPDSPFTDNLLRKWKNKNNTSSKPETASTTVSTTTLTAVLVQTV